MGRDENLFEGKNLDEAVRKGLDALGLARAEVIITVVDEGSGGFLGLGARPYKVRVVPRPGGAPREADSRDRDDAGRSRHPRGGRDRQSRGGRDERRGGREREDRGVRAAPADRAPRGERPERSGVRSERGAGRGERRDRADRGDRGARGERPRSGDRDRDRGERRPERPAPMMAERPAEAPPPHAESMPRAMSRDDAPASDRGDGRRRRRRGGRSRGDDGGAPREPRPYAPAPRSYEGDRPGDEATAVATAPPEPAAPGMPPAELEQQAVRITTDLFSAMGYDASVSATAEDATRVEVRAVVPSGEEELTGRKGEVRQALQHLLNRMLNRGRVSEYHLQLEINDFWQRREEELRQLAQDLAEEALSGQREAVTEYLNAQERRIIHVALKEDARVKTYALGTGLIKRVAVAPADFPEQGRYEE